MKMVFPLVGNEVSKHFRCCLARADQQSQGDKNRISCLTAFPVKHPIFRAVLLAAHHGTIHQTTNLTGTARSFFFAGHRVQVKKSPLLFSCLARAEQHGSRMIKIGISLLTQAKKSGKTDTQNYFKLFLPG